MSKKDKDIRHEKNRQREMEIKAKKTAEALANPSKVSETFRHLSQGIQNKIANTVTNTLVKTSGVTAETTPENLKRYCIFVLSLISGARFDPTGTALNKIRQNIQQNLPKDIDDFLKEGKTKEEITNFYWDVPEFQKMWEKLGWDKNYLESMI